MTEQKSKGGRVAMEWLARYARHCGIQPEGGQPLEAVLRSRFSHAAWRVVCRSGKAPFVPLLRNRELGFDDLVTYCGRLAEHGCGRAPQADLLAFFITQRRLYFTERCTIPTGIDFQLMRIASKEHSVSWSSLALVSNWIEESGLTLGKKSTWRNLFVRARQAWQRKMLSSHATAVEPWHFFCADVRWRGHLIRPLRDVASLWAEGMAMGNCLYSLRRLCSAPRPSRFFSVTWEGRRLATLELCWSPPEAGHSGMHREVGQWRVRDVRLSFNRVPSERLCESMVEFARMYDTWARTPSRWPSGHLDAMRHRIEQVSRRTVPGGVNRDRSPIRGSTVFSAGHVGARWTAGPYDLAQWVTAA